MWNIRKALKSLLIYRFCFSPLNFWTNVSLQFHNSLWKTIIGINITAIQWNRCKAAATLGCAHTRRAGGYKQAVAKKKVSEVQVFCLGRLPEAPCPEDSHQRAGAAGREAPGSFVQSWFSFWLCMYRYPAGTLWHRELAQEGRERGKAEKGERSWTGLKVSRSVCVVPGRDLEPGLGVRPRALITSTSSWPFLSIKPIWTSPAGDKPDVGPDSF